MCLSSLVLVLSFGSSLEPFDVPFINTNCKTAIGLTLFFVVLNKHQKEYAIMERCKCCGSVYTHKSVGNDFCTINCFKFHHNRGNVESTIHQIISKLKDYNDADAELDTMEKVFTYKEHQALVD